MKLRGSALRVLPLRGILPTSGAGASYRALVMVSGSLRQITDVELGTLKPVVLYNGEIRRQATTEGVPLVLVNGSLRTLAAGDTLII